LGGGYLEQIYDQRFFELSVKASELHPAPLTERNHPIFEYVTKEIREFALDLARARADVIEPVLGVFSACYTISKREREPFSIVDVDSAELFRFVLGAASPQNVAYFYDSAYMTKNYFLSLPVDTRFNINSLCRDYVRVSMWGVRGDVRGFLSLDLGAQLRYLEGIRNILDILRDCRAYRADNLLHTHFSLNNFDPVIGN